jgi:hypothetical protein
MAGSLLRAHVRGRPHDLPIERDHHLGLGSKRETQVDHDRLAKLGSVSIIERLTGFLAVNGRAICELHHDVGRLHIPMYKPALVSVVERVGDFRNHFDRLAERQPPDLQ